MKYVVPFLVGGIIGAIVGALWIGPERVGALSEADAVAIEAAAVSQAEAAVALDWGAFASHYTPGGLMLVPGEPAVEGREAIAAITSGSDVVDFATTAQTIEGCSELAYRLGTYTFKFPLPGSEEPGIDTGKFVEIWKKQPDGSWLIAVDIWNAGPLAAAGG